MLTMFNIVMGVFIAAVSLPVIDALTDPVEFFTRWCPFRR